MSENEVELIVKELTAERVTGWTNAMKGFKPLSFEQMKILAKEKGFLYSQFKDIRDFFLVTHKNVKASQLLRIVRDRQKALGLAPNCNFWKLNGIRQFVRAYEKPDETISKLTSPNHRIIRDMLHGLGQLRGYVSEREYPFNNWQLDVAWKKTKKGVPSYVFEVQIKGDLYRAVTKLSYALDQWNCRAVLVTTDEFIDVAKQLFESAKHEPNEEIMVINWKDAQELYELALAYETKRDKLGLQF